MPDYPKIEDKNFNSKIADIFKKYKIIEKASFNDICYPTKFKHQTPQEFVAKYMGPETMYKGLLVFHTIGAGKTCAAVNIAEQWVKKKEIIVVTPASLINNFRTELRTKCAHNNYISDADRAKLKSFHPTSDTYKKIIKESDNLINKYYQILSYNKFINLCNDNLLNLKNKILIIDEIQNMISEHGTYYKTLYNIIQKAPKDLKIVLLSATPIFDKPIEICLTLNLLRLPIELPVGSEFYSLFLKKVKDKSTNLTYYKTKNMDIFKDRIKGYVSYYRGAPPYVFPEKRIKYVKCEMEKFQYQSYLTVKNKEGNKFSGDILDLPNDFFLGLRFISNIAFPNKNINEDGFDSFTDKFLHLDNLKKYSIKFYKIIKKIKKCDGTIFIYSNFKEYGGIKSFIKVLEYNGYLNYINHGEGFHRFAIWSGDVHITMKEQIKTIFNNINNKNGQKIKILLGSPSIKEGVSLLRVKQVHIMEPYWNMSRQEQIIGRAVRFCSHKDVPKDERYVDIYIYIATNENEKETIDEYIRTLAHYKNKLIGDFERALKESAVDCLLNKNANVYPKEEDIICTK